MKDDGPLDLINVFFVHNERNPTRRTDEVQFPLL
jgi:hypothetical protein